MNIFETRHGMKLGNLLERFLSRKLRKENNLCEFTT